MAYIYVITNNINQKQYVGKTSQSIEDRFKMHIKDSKTEKAKQRPLYRAMNKYGIEHFSICQLEECLESEASEREIYWISKLNTYSNGYNATLGGDGKTLYDYSLLASKYKELKTIKAVAEYYNCDESTVSHACHAMKVQIIPNYDKAKEQKSIPIYQLDKKTETVIKKFNSIADAARYLVDNNMASSKSLSGIRSHISSCCKGNRKTAYGYKWKYNISG